MTTETEVFIIAYDWAGWYWGGPRRRWVQGLDQVKTYSKRSTAAAVATRLNSQAECLIASVLTLTEAQERDGQ